MGNDRQPPSSTRDAILERLELLERRVARLEAAAGIGRRAAGQPVTGAHARTPVDAGPHAATPPQRAMDWPAEPAADTPDSESPPTERLTPVTPRPTEDPFPDLSLLEQKLEYRKGPPQVAQVRAALEEHPRICARIQQLWGTTECEPYLNTLVIDTRGNRKGFPPAMMDELLYLGRLARALVILSVT